MSKERIYLSPPHQTGDELEALQKVLSSNWLAPVGPDLERFEQALCEVTGFKYAVATSSGTAALHLGLKIIGVSQQETVLSSNMTFIGAVNPILYQGANPIFIDSELTSWNLDTELVGNCLKDGSMKVRAIVPTHLYGTPAEVTKLEELGRVFNVPLLHDLAECLTGKVEQKRIGELVDRGVLSFNGNKLITTSGGGAFMTNSKEEADRALYLATQAKSNSSSYHHEEIGYNYRMSNVLAALGNAQIQNLEERVFKKKKIYEAYRAELLPLGLDFQEELDGITSDRWLTCVLTSPERAMTIEDIVLKMAQSNVEVRPLWKPMHLQPVFNSERFIGGQVSENLFSRGLCLPSGCGLSEDQQAYVIDLLKTLII